MPIKNGNTEFVFVTHYPSSKRPFYTMDDPSDPNVTFSFDLLFRNLEITTGGQRLNKYEDYIAKMTRLGWPSTFSIRICKTFNIACSARRSRTRTWAAHSPTLRAFKRQRSEPFPKRHQQTRTVKNPESFLGVQDRYHITTEELQPNQKVLL